MIGMIINTDGSNEVIEFDRDNELKTLQGAVGGYIETVLRLEDLLVFANEEGLLMGLPVAPYATLLVNTIRYQNNIPRLSGMLVGNVVLVGVDSDGDTGNLSDEWFAKITSIIPPVGV